MNQSVFYVDKTTDTFADVLLTYGVAALLDRLLRDSVGQRTVRVKDAGSVFAIELEEPMREEYADVAWFCDVPFLKAWGKKPPEDWRGEIVDYDVEWDRFAGYRKAYDQLPSEAKHPGATVDEYPALAAIRALSPRDDWDILSQIPPMQAINAYVSALNGWFECRLCFSDLLSLLLSLFGTTPNDIGKAKSTWKALRKEHELKTKCDAATPIQIVNPGMGKGINRSKADGATRLDNLDSFWPLEYLKFLGMYQAGLPRSVKNSKDRKTYVLWPNNITLDTLRKVYRRFNAVMWPNTAVKMDVLAALRYTDVFLEQWLAGQLEDARYGQPGDHVSGLAVAFYKKMGRASSVLNLAKIGVPEWMAIDAPKQARAYRALLEEHRRVVTSLDERRGDQYRLLQLYRDFLSGNDLWSFFEFTNAYSSYVISQRERRGGYARQFSEDNLGRLIMNIEPKLGKILETEGFKRIAYAIRQSTVIPQYRKSRAAQNKGPRPLYSIRYGLGAQLVRKAAYREEFIQELGEFLHNYLNETAQVYERLSRQYPNGFPEQVLRQMRRAISESDLDEVIKLIDLFDGNSKLIGSLLVAYGYARSSRKESKSSQESDQD